MTAGLFALGLLLPESGLAAQTYLELAKRTLDPRVARRAVEVASGAKLPDAAIEAAKLWHTLEPTAPQALQVTAALLVSAKRVDEAQPYLEQCLAIARDLDDKVSSSAVLQPLGLALLGRGEFAAARRHLQEGLALAEELGNPREIAGALNALAQTARAEGDFVTAEPLYARVLDIAHRTGELDIIAVSLLNLAMVATARNANEDARAMLGKVLEIVDDSGLKPAAQSLLEVSAGLAAAQGEWLHAARFFGAAEAQTAETGLHRDPADEAFLAPFMARARDRLGAAAFAQADAAGRTLAFDEAMTELRGWLSSRG